MGNGDDLPTLAWRVTQVEQLLAEQRKDRLAIRIFTGGLVLNSLLGLAGLLIAAKVF